MNKKIALVLGANGQDGSYMLELLLNKGYEVHGTIRRCSVITTERINHIFNKVTLHYIDVTDCMNVFNIISKVNPCEIYNFAAQSHVKISAELENYTFQVNTLGILNVLQSVKNLGMVKRCKIYQASTSEIMGNQTDGTLKMNELTQQSPCSVYGISKYAAQQLCNMYRDAYGMFVVNSILYNHESERRGHNFVTQKIANYVAKWAYGTMHEPLQLGNLDARRDWGSARLYMEAVYLMMQQETPENFVIATGETHSVREFVEIAFSIIEIEILWKGTGVNEIGIIKGTENDSNPIVIVQINPKYYRDIEIECLIGDASKAENVLGWKYDYPFTNLVKEMVGAAISRTG
jgi:GDPmannose 4,6-dehydratase